MGQPHEPLPVSDPLPRTDGVAWRWPDAWILLDRNEPRFADLVELVPDHEESSPAWRIRWGDHDQDRDDMHNRGVEIVVVSADGLIGTHPYLDGRIAVIPMRYS